MNLDVVLLGLISGLRPATAQAAVIALLRAPRPRLTLLAFNLVGIVWSLAAGAVIVIAFDGVGSQLGHRDFAFVVDIIAGVAALGFAAGVQRGRVAQRLQNRRPSDGDSRLTRRLRNPSLVEAGIAGIVTHLPGLIYLVALNAIAAQNLRFARFGVQLGIYNALWFALPLTALVLALSDPAMIGDSIERATGWARRNRDRLLIVIFGALGVYLLVKGTLGLLG